MGRPSEMLSEKDQLKLHYGNKLFFWTMAMVRECLKAEVPFVIENPRTSMLWYAPKMLQLLRDPRCCRTNLDFCQFHVPWKKATSLLSFNIPDLDPLQKQCASRGICSWSGLPHVVLSGTDPQGVFWTSRASPYPDKFAMTAARVIYATIIGGKVERAAAAAQVTRA